MHFESVDDAEHALVECGLPGVLLDPNEFGSELGDVEKVGASRVKIVESHASAG